MWQTLSKAILRHKWVILSVIALATVFFGYKAVTALKLDNRYGVLLPNNADAAIKYKKFKEIFGEDGGTLVVAVQTDSMYTESTFRKWKQLGDSILAMDGVEGVVSEATLVTIHNNKEDRKFEARPVFADETYSEKSIKLIEEEVKSNPIFNGLLYNDNNVSLMMIAVNEDYLLDQKKANIVLDIENLVESYHGTFGKPKFAGLPHLRVVIGKRVVNEMYIFVALLILVSAILLYFFFRSFKVVLVCLIVVGVTVIWSMGVIATMNFSLTIIMALIPPLMIVIGIPNCVFLITKFHQEIKIHGNKGKALSRVIQKIGTAAFLTNLTTSLGFLTFVTTNSDKLMQFGLSASINIMIVFVLSITILPIFLAMVSSPEERHLRHLDRKLAVGLLNNLVNISVNHRPKVYLVTLGVIILSVIGLSRIEATGNLTGDLPEGDPILTDLNFIQKEFGGAIPFEILIEYKEPSRLVKKSTLLGIEQVQEKYSQDTLFSKQLSFIDLLKAANMAYYDNDPEEYRLITKKRHLATLQRYFDSSVVTNSRSATISMRELIDTANKIIRIRTQAKDAGSFEIGDKVNVMYREIDSILNPNRAQYEVWLSKYNESKKSVYLDSILEDNAIVNAVAENYITSDEVELKFYEDPTGFLQRKYKQKDFFKNLKNAIELESFGITLTGSSVVAAEGTKYLVINLLTSLLFAILAVAILMAILFRSWRMVLVSMVPNFIPLLFTAGIMGWFGIPLKPSTLLVFSIAFGISVDDTIHYLAKYRQELKHRNWDLKACAIMAIREAGLGMFYTSIVLFCGFSMFTFSQFGGTQALGLLVSITLLVAMLTNLVVLPSLLLSLERRITTKSFTEPYFDAYNEESDIDWGGVDVKLNDNEEQNTT